VNTRSHHPKHDPDGGTGRARGVSAAAPEAVRADRAAGVVVASACGDALGAGYEFGPSLGTEVDVHMKGGGAFDWAPGEWTDDTQLALAILAPIADGDTDPLPAIEVGFRAWFASDPADVGNQTRRALSDERPLAVAAADDAERNPGAAGNGSLMRTGPVALAHPGDPAAIAELAARVSALTHATDDCVDACVLWSVAIDATVRQAPGSAEAHDWAGPLRDALVHIPAARRATWRERIDEATTADPRQFVENGWVVHAFQAALASICSTPAPDDEPSCVHLQRALDRAVRCGGDTDTVAAIAGSLLGARWGATAVPLAWRRVVHGRRTYDAPVERAADLERLARLAHDGGRPDQQGWPGVPSLRDHYEQHFPARPLLVDVEEVRFGNVHALDRAIATDADVVVSLCRMGTAEVRPPAEHHVLGLIDSNADDNPNAAFLLTDLASTLRTLVDEGHRPFVHCVQAENRTPAAAIAWLIANGVGAEAAVERVAAALDRPQPFLVDASVTGT